MSLTVGEIGEQGLLQRLQQFCPSELMGDDAAVLPFPADHSLVVTTDVLVDGVHFSDRTTSGFDVGWRAAAANLSDLAAMGAMPLGITVGLGLPGDRRVDWVEQVYQGLVACLQPFQTPIMGGDICRSSVTTLAITALGRVNPQRVIRRSAAQVGDVIVVTGAHGLSRAGLELLLHPDQGLELPEAVRSRLIQAHQRPIPRLDVVPHLQALMPEDRAIAGMDSSDGLADAVLQICRASGVGAELECSQIPLPPGLEGWVTSAQALQWALYGGEDFELVLCLPSEVASELMPVLGQKAAVVGTITPGLEVRLVDCIGNSPAERLTLQKGFQHF